MAFHPVAQYLEHDYLKDGFWAMSKKEELPNPDMSVTFLVRIEDVTDQVLANVKDGMNRTGTNSMRLM